MSPPPRQLKMGQVPRYVKNKYQFVVSRQTVYNWTKRGIRLETLEHIYVKAHPTSKHPTVKVTTDRWVDQFLARCGIQPAVSGPAEDRDDNAPESDPG